MLIGGFMADRWARRNMRGHIHTGAIGLSLTIPLLVLLSYVANPALALCAAVIYELGCGLFDVTNAAIAVISIGKLTPHWARASGS